MTRGAGAGSETECTYLDQWERETGRINGATEPRQMSSTSIALLLNHDE